MCTCDECIMDLQKELQKGVKGVLDIEVTHNYVVIWVVRYGTTFRMVINKKRIGGRELPVHTKKIF